jgi:hypothetical protein
MPQQWSWHPVLAVLSHLEVVWDEEKQHLDGEMVVECSDPVVSPGELVLGKGGIDLSI